MSRSGLIGELAGRYVTPFETTNDWPLIESVILEHSVLSTTSHAVPAVRTANLMPKPRCTDDAFCSRLKVYCIPLERSGIWLEPKIARTFPLRLRSPPRGSRKTTRRVRSTSLTYGSDDFDASGSLPNLLSKGVAIVRRRSRGSLRRLHLDRVGNSSGDQLSLSFNAAVGAGADLFPSVRRCLTCKHLLNKSAV